MTRRIDLTKIYSSYSTDIILRVEGRGGGRTGIVLSPPESMKCMKLSWSLGGNDGQGLALNGFGRWEGQKEILTVFWGAMTVFWGAMFDDVPCNHDNRFCNLL